MGILHYQVIYCGYHNDVQHWKYPPRMGKFEVNDYYFDDTVKIEFYPSAIVFDDDNYDYDDDYGCHPSVIKLDEQDEENQSYIVAGWYWRYEKEFGHPSLNTHTEYATDGYWELPYFSQE